MRKNNVLKTAMYEAAVTHGDLAKEMGIGTQTFSNKLNHCVVNGYRAYFSVAEKAWLANKFNIDVNEIE